MNKRHDIPRILKESAIKVTPQRSAVLEYLYGNPDHPSVDEVYQYVKKQFPYIARATIYNTINTLTESGLLQEIMVRQEKRHMDWNVTPHHHFKCLNCDRVQDVPYDVLTPDQVSKKVKDFRVHHVKVVMEGICNKCP
jgi:Fur family transcriptional regulator, peroxide stress response regulator